MQKVRHGWVFEIKGKPGVYVTNWSSCKCLQTTSNDLLQAIRVSTRKYGRRVKHQNEVLRKVQVNEHGVNIKIIPGR
jgi:hypothetical protein